MTCDEGHIAPEIEASLRLQHPECCQADGHECGLGVGRQGQFRIGTFEGQPRQRLTQRIVDLVEDRTGRREGCRESLAHAGRL